MAKHNEIGKWGEDIATRYLSEKGYHIIARDWQSGHRDIDIIATDGNVVVFVEVKTRRNQLFGSPEEAVGYMKLQNLRVAINHFVKFKQITQQIRFDVVSIVGTPDGGPPQISHIKDFPLF